MKSTVHTMSALRQEARHRMILTGLAILAALGILVIGLLADASLLALTASAGTPPSSSCQPITSVAVICHLKNLTITVPAAQQRAAPSMSIAPAGAVGAGLDACWA